MKRIARVFRDRMIGAPEGAGLENIQRSMQAGSGAQRVRALRELSLRQLDAQSQKWLLLGLKDSVPGVRRAAAHSLGVIGAQGQWGPILDAIRHERCDEPLLAMCVAAVRLGLPTLDGWEYLYTRAIRRTVTWYGVKELGEAVGFGRVEAERRWRLALDPLSDADPHEIKPRNRAELRHYLRQQIADDVRNVDGLEALGAQQHPEDFELLQQRAGRTKGVESHAGVHAIGLHGDPRALRKLRRQLRGWGVDPGHGYQSRRAVALALGRHGLPQVGRTIKGALEDEALEYEGRPGAGLGIQIPVRASLLYALGEAGASEHISMVGQYLANTTGTVLGGFYLPAMDALIKLNAVKCVTELARGPELLSANAIGVLGALKQFDTVRMYLNDPRPRVSEAANQALKL